MLEFRLIQLMFSLLENAMKLYQLKNIFKQAFELEPTAKNVRKILKDNDKRIPRNDFRCTKAWEQALDSFGLLSSSRAFEARRTSQELARGRRSNCSEISARAMARPIDFELIDELTEYELSLAGFN